MGGKDKEKKGPGAPGGPRHGAPAPADCGGERCHKRPWRFGFCEVHYEQYKFGLINREGKAVPDYEKKFEHYQRFLEKRGARKAA